MRGAEPWLGCTHLCMEGLARCYLFHEGAVTVGTVQCPFQTQEGFSSSLYLFSYRKPGGHIQHTAEPQPTCHSPGQPLTHSLRPRQPPLRPAPLCPCSAGSQPPPPQAGCSRPLRRPSLPAPSGQQEGAVGVALAALQAGVLGEAGLAQGVAHRGHGGPAHMRAGSGGGTWVSAYTAWLLAA